VNLYKVTTMITIMFASLFTCLQADVFLGSIKTESIADPGLGFKAQDPGTSKIVSLEAENKRLKEKVKELESQIEVLKEDDVTVEVKSEPSVKVEVLSKVFKGAKLVIGGKAPKKLSTYYAARLQNIDDLKQKLEANGFEVLAVTPILKGKTVLSITNDELLQTNTWMAALHLLVNEGNEIRVQNPSYFGAAFLQDTYKYGQFTETLKALQAVLGDMYEVKEKYMLEDLPKYQFMFGMPYLGDTIKVGEGDDLLVKVADGNENKYVAYTLKLPNGNVLVGHKLRTITNKFLQKIGAERDANILPYESMITGKKAVMLDPKFYLALSLPQLSMSEFMKIASAPGEIEKDVKRAYK